MPDAPQIAVAGRPYDCRCVQPSVVVASMGPPRREERAMRAARGPTLHADGDSFFASVALRDRPDLAGRPVAVVAHVFIASATYPTRAFGVRGGQHVDEALRLCPQLVLLDVDRAAVEEVGDALFDVFRSSAGAAPAHQDRAALASARCTPRRRSRARDRGIARPHPRMRDRGRRPPRRCGHRAWQRAARRRARWAARSCCAHPAARA